MTPKKKPRVEAWAVVDDVDGSIIDFHDEKGTILSLLEKAGGR